MQNTVEKTTDSAATAAAEIQHPATTAVVAKASSGKPKTRAAKVKAAKADKPATTPRRFVPTAKPAPEPAAEPVVEPVVEVATETTEAAPVAAAPDVASQVAAMYAHLPESTLALLAAEVLQLRQQQPLQVNQRVLQYENPTDMLHLAKDLAKFVKDNKLSSEVQGKNFVNVEGWAYAGSRLGYMPEVVACCCLSTEAEVKYQAEVVIKHLATAQVVGRGFAICSNKEQGKKFYQEFAINSMAQTRATGKAYRNILAWVMRAAGYEATPAEEMDYDSSQGKQPATPVVASQPTAAPAAAPAPETEQPAAAVVNTAAAIRVLPPTGKEGQPIDAQQPAVQYASTAQKEEVIRLLNHPVITRPEKTKMLLSINRLDEDRADQAIAKLKQAIKDREEGK